MKVLARSLIALLSLALAAPNAIAQVKLKGSAVVYCGAASQTSAPASIDEKRVRDATPEWQTIRSEGVKHGSARYALLVAEADKRIKEAVKAASSDAGKDLVVRSGDVEDAQGKDVADITDQVIAKLSTVP
jgi:Skp family chaperone for outer membrane proteins